MTPAVNEKLEALRRQLAEGFSKKHSELGMVLRPVGHLFEYTADHLTQGENFMEEALKAVLPVRGEFSPADAKRLVEGIEELRDAARLQTKKALALKALVGKMVSDVEKETWT